MAPAPISSVPGSSSSSSNDNGPSDASESAARSAFNLKVMKRQDPHIAEIVYSASFVVLYQYSNSNTSWSKTGIEGPMFLYKRTISPHYGMFVLNRNGVENFSVPLTKDDELQLTDQFVILRTEEETCLDRDEDEEGEEEVETIVGVWVFEKDQRTLVGQAMLDLQERAGREDRIAPPTPPLTQQQGQENISLDALFASAPASASAPPTAPASAPSAATGSALLDAIFQSAAAPPTTSAQTSSSSSSSSPPVRAPPQQQSSNQSADSAAGLMAMLGLSSAAAAPASKGGPVEVPAVTPTADTNGRHVAHAPSFSETASQVLTDAHAESSSSPSASPTEPPLSKGEFVREILSLIHTDKAFTQDLYERYLSTRRG